MPTAEPSERNRVYRPLRSKAISSNSAPNPPVTRALSLPSARRIQARRWSSRVARKATERPSGVQTGRSASCSSCEMGLKAPVRSCFTQIWLPREPLRARAIWLPSGERTADEKPPLSMVSTGTSRPLRSIQTTLTSPPCPG